MNFDQPGPGGTQALQCEGQDVDVPFTEHFHPCVTLIPHWGKHQPGLVEQALFLFDNLDIQETSCVAVARLEEILQHCVILGILYSSSMDQGSSLSLEAWLGCRVLRRLEMVNV